MKCPDGDFLLLIWSEPWLPRIRKMASWCEGQGITVSDLCRPTAAKIGCLPRERHPFGGEMIDNLAPDLENAAKSTRSVPLACFMRCGAMQLKSVFVLSALACCCACSPSGKQRAARQAGAENEEADAMTDNPYAITEAKLRQAIDAARKNHEKSLSIHGDGVVDLTPLAELPDLESLELSCGDISDYRPLASLLNLKRLVLISDQHSDLRPLAALQNLETLSVTDGRVTDLSPLAGLGRLRELSFHFCSQLSNLGPLENLAELKRLTLEECDRVTDLRPLAKCTALERLDFTDCFELQDVTPLSGLSNLRRLVLAGTKVTDTSSLSKLPNLKITFEESEDEDQ
ncbi:MAG TPA: leucine-rich repeat domain-containing protein [Pirellulales bacterium]|nr:leucine-rich repeat domain-containing protein [Pirellulales bacterium]